MASKRRSSVVGGGMTRVLMFGFGPLPIENLRTMAPGLRTWHFLRVLLDAGHDVWLVANRVYGTYPDDLPGIVSQRKDRWTYYSIADVHWHNPSVMRPLLADARAECVVAVTTPASAVATDTVGGLPMWADLYGSIMAEAQLKALVYGDDTYLSHFWTMERKAIERGDIFSTVSERQKWSLIGELGMWGRLNQWTSGYDFATAMPIASETTPYQSRRSVLRETIGEDAFVILYSGGYNTWTDVDTLFNALEVVLCQCPNVVLVSTGGKIEGHDDMTYTRFQKLIEGSRYRERYHLRGWVPSEDIPSYYLESNVAVNVDRPSYEAMLGSRTRALDWMRAGLPCVLSSLTELSDEIEKAGAGLTYRPGDSQDLVRCLLQCINDPKAAAEMGQRGRQLLLERFTFEATSKRLLEWVEKPTHAPDFGHNIPKLVSSSQSVSTQIVQAIERRSLSLSLALRVWPAITAVTTALGLQSIEKPLASFGMRALRLDRSQYQAQYLTCTVPQQMRARGVYDGEVRLRNSSSLPWLTAQQSDKGINLSYHWTTPEGVMLIKEGVRSVLPETVKPGKAITVRFQVAAPEKPGRYQLALDLVREGVTWFSEAGSPGPSFAIDVNEN
jgi:glycosyltransferase involved in cell wall biosynthesis